ncbi:MAG: type II secretion system protein GspL [Aureliella sp.]
MSMEYRFIQERGESWEDVGATFPATDSQESAANADETLDTESVVQSIARKKNESCVILLRASSVFFSRFAAHEVEGARNHQTLSFRFEEDLPFDAEQLACDFLFDGDFEAGESVTAIGTGIESLASIVQSLQSRGLAIRGICPWALLATQALVRSQSLGSEGCFAFQGSVSWSLVAWREDRLVGWRTGIPSQVFEPEIQLFIRQLKLDEHIHALPDEVPDTSLPVTKMSSAEIARSVSSLLSSKEKLWCDFRRDPRLSRSTSEQRLKRSLMLAAICCLAVGISLFAKSWSLGQQRLSVSDQQVEIFKQAFPGARVPSAVLKRLQSELTKLRGVSDPSRDVTQKGRAFPVMGALLRGLPSDIDFTVEEARADDRNARLTMLLKDYDEAAAVVEGLSQAGFDVGPPATESVGNELRAVISASELNDE